MSKDNDATILHDSPEPPAYLAARILRRIKKEERRKAFRQMVGGRLAGFVRIVRRKLVRSWHQLRNPVSFRLLPCLVRLSFAMANLHELALSLEESFPAMSAAFCIASVVLAVWFGARLMSEAGVIGGIDSRRIIFYERHF